MQKFLDQTLTVMPTLFQSFSALECEEFLLILTKALKSDARSLSAKEQRQKRRSLVLQLGDEIEDAESIADTLVDMGIYDEVENIMDLLKKPAGRDVLELAYKLSELKKGTQTINTATERASKVVFALKSYAHQDNSGRKVSTQIIRGIENILTLYQSQIKHGIELIKNYADDVPMIDCYPDELNQVWTNLIHNSLQAMDHKGTLTISVAQQDNDLKISIQDSGRGIPAENMPKIFDAFFTTKLAGEGSGLGLHIIKKIVDKHAGRIEVESQPGCTIFSVFLPLNADTESK
jgi:signal transduction histidine kinase